MRFRAAFTLLALLPVAALTVAADHGECAVLDDGGTPETSDDVLACPSVAYLGGCDDYAGGKVYQPLVHGSNVPLVSDAPDASFTSGAGCGTFDDPLLRGTRTDTQFSFDVTGLVPGNPETLTVELHDISAAQMRASGTTTLDVRLTIADEFPLGSEQNTSVDGTVSQSPKTVEIPIEAVTSSTGLSDALVFTITDLSAVLSDDVYSAGTGEGQWVTLTIDLPRDGAHVLVWGATEVPASVSFNTEVRGTVVSALEHAG